jgi:iron complex transport system substrate-binding protein
VRVVSLVPSATEIAAALGVADRLVGVTHDCDYPPEIRSLPKVTRSTIPPGSTSGEIDRLVRTAGAQGESTFHLDGEVLRALRPDVILGQTICRVCAVTLAQVPRDLPTSPFVVPLDAESLEGVFADVARVAEALAVPERGAALVRSLRARLATVAARVSGVPRPSVACLEWLEPIFNGGHWVPEQVAIAGGVDILGRPGERSREIAWEELARAAPEVLVVMPCGFGVARAAEDALLLRRLAGWDRLPAVRTGRVFAADGSSYFSRPGPRLVEGIELLAALFHPTRFPAPDSAAAVPILAPARA